MLAENSSDSVLWKEVQNNNSGAFAILFKRYWSDVFIVAFALLKDRSACADLVQDIFLRVWEKRSHLQIQSFKPYLQASARYHVYKIMRDKQVSPMTLTPDFAELPSMAVSTSPLLETSHLELQMEIDESLVQLPKRCQEIFCLSRIDHLSNDEIATRLEISKRTVENQLTHALRHLRVSLKDLAV